MSYRIFYTLVCTGIFILAGCQGEVDNKQPASPPISAVPPGPNTVGKVMPPDAAPLDQQIYRWLLIEPTSLDANVAIYQAQSGVFAFEGLTWLNHDSELVPGAADRWESSEDGTIWTFYLRKDAKWSDGRPVTAHDFVYTFIRAVDPASANVYAFFYYPIKGAKAFSQGKTKDRSTIGVRAVDDYTLVIETDGPCPYLPQITAFTGSGAVPRWQVEKYEEKWTEPEYCVTNSTFKLERWDAGQSFEFVLNPYYNGPQKAYLERLIGTFIGAETAVSTLPYENNEVDFQRVMAREIPALRNHPVLGMELAFYSAFDTYFLIFNTEEKPFDDLRVRQAISHVIDREVLSNVVLQGTATPAYSMLPPGYPGDAGHTLDNIQRYDPDAGRKLLAEAGYPNGRGFPRKDLILRGADMKHAAEAIQQMIKDQLNVNLSINILEARTYSTALYQWKLPISIGSFSQDYPDPNNMLATVWRSQPKPFGRQPWKNEAFDKLVDDAAREMNQEKRAIMYADAQRILVEDVGGAFLFFNKEASLRKPWLKGFKRNKVGEYPYRNLIDIYIANNVQR